MERTRQMTAEGAAAREVAEALGVHIRKVYEYRREMGLHTSRKRRSFNSYKMSPERILKIQARIDQGWTLKRIRKEERIAHETLIKYYLGKHWRRDHNGVLVVENAKPPRKIWPGETQADNYK